MNGHDHEIDWSDGETSIHLQIEKALAAHPRPTTLLHESAHRTVHRIVLEEAPNTSASRPTNSVAAKIHRTVTGRHPLREMWKRWLGMSPARREWKALGDLYEAGVPVPRPRARGRLASGDEIIVTDFIDGQRVTGTQSETVDAMASAIAKLHDAGYRHGDLHLGNLLVVDQEIVLLDLQRARPQQSTRDRLWDLARLELSLSKAGWNPSARKALRDRLGVGEAFDPILRRFLRDHLRGRARRVLRVGRNWSIARFQRLRGLRDVSLGEAALARLIESCEHETNIRERRDGRVQLIECEPADPDDPNDGERVVLVKRIAAGGLRRALGDSLRGTPAARAFHAGQSLGLLSDRAARPLAYLEERRFGLPWKSWLVLEKVGDEDLDRLLPSSPKAERRLARALGEWLAEGHAWGLSHRDLKASNLRVTIRTDSIQFWMVDLEDLSGPAEQSEEARLHALSQLNASLTDDAFGVEARLAALETYQARVPFAPRRAGGGENAEDESPAAEIARRSLARAHRWRADDCQCLDR